MSPMIRAGVRPWLVNEDRAPGIYLLTRSVLQPWWIMGRTARRMDGWIRRPSAGVQNTSVVSGHSANSTSPPPRARDARTWNQDKEPLDVPGPERIHPHLTKYYSVPPQSSRSTAVRTTSHGDLGIPDVRVDGDLRPYGKQRSAGEAFPISHQ